MNKFMPLHIDAFHTSWFEGAINHDTNRPNIVVKLVL
jgi:hypothetical protein